MRPVYAMGIVAAVDTRAIGNAIIELGGGRRQVGEELDLSVGFSDIAPIGTALDGRHAAGGRPRGLRADDADQAEKNLRAACSVDWVTR